MAIHTSSYTADEIDSILLKSYEANRGIELTSGYNLNNISRPGKYVCRTSAVAQTLTNCPVSSSFILHTFNAWTDYTLYQILFPGDEGFLYYRGKISNSWQGWNLIEMRAGRFPKVGTTAQRPALNYRGGVRNTAGEQYFDTTLKKPIFYVGDRTDSNGNIISSTGWVDANGNPV